MPLNALSNGFKVTVQHEGEIYKLVLSSDHPNFREVGREMLKKMSECMTNHGSEILCVKSLDLVVNEIEIAS